MFYWLLLAGVTVFVMFKLYGLSAKGAEVRKIKEIMIEKGYNDVWFFTTESDKNNQGIISYSDSIKKFFVARKVQDKINYKIFDPLAIRRFYEVEISAKKGEAVKKALHIETNIKGISDLHIESMEEGKRLSKLRTILKESTEAGGDHELFEDSFIFEEGNEKLDVKEVDRSGNKGAIIGGAITLLLGVALFFIFSTPEKEKQERLKSRICSQAIQQARAEMTGALWREYSGISSCTFHPEGWLPNLSGVDEGTLSSSVRIKDDSPLRLRGVASRIPFEASFRIREGELSLMTIARQ